MRTGAGLALICVGAIFAFAVTASNSVVNLRTAGWVIMIVGFVGLVIPRKTYGWLGRRIVRRTRAYPGSSRVEEVSVPHYAAYSPGTQINATLPGTTMVTEDSAETEVVEDIYEP
jgi:Domain of unknown function (DUF6458)